MDGWGEEAKCVEECCRPPLAGESATGCAPGLTRGRPPPLAHAWASFGPDRTRPPAMGSASTRRAYHAVGLRGSDASCKERIRPRAPSSGAASARRCSIGRMREYVLRRRSRVLPRRESGARAPMLGAGAGPPPPSAELLLGNDGKESRFTAAVGERGRRRWMHGR